MFCHELKLNFVYRVGHWYLSKKLQWWLMISNWLEYVSGMWILWGKKLELRTCLPTYHHVLNFGMGSALVTQGIGLYTVWIYYISSNLLDLVESVESNLYQIWKYDISNISHFSDFGYRILAIGEAFVTYAFPFLFTIVMDIAVLYQSANSR